LTVRSFNYSEYDLFAFQFVLHLQEKLHDTHVFVICLKNVVHLKHYLSQDMKMITVYSFQAYVTSFI